MTDEELITALQKRLIRSGPALWLVWTSADADSSHLQISNVRHPRIVIADSSPAARKLWREHMFKHHPHVSMSLNCESCSIPVDAMPGVMAEEGLSEFLESMGFYNTSR